MSDTTRSKETEAAKTVQKQPKQKANSGVKNLRPQNTRSKDEQRAISAMGGRASGEARRRRKTLREELLLLLDDGNTREAVSAALIRSAKKGSVKAFEVLRDTIGERPVERSAHTIVGVEALQAMSDAELVQLAESGATGGSGDGTAG